MHLPADDAQVGRFLTIADTAEILAISAAQAYELITVGDLPAIRLTSRGQWRVEREVLEGFIAAKYEEARRMSLWNGARLDSLPEIGGGRILR